MVNVEKSKGSREDIGGAVGPGDGVSPRATDEGEGCAMADKNSAGLRVDVAVGIASVAGPRGTVCEVDGDGMYGVHTSDGTSHDLHTMSCMRFNLYCNSLSTLVTVNIECADDLVF